MVRVPADGKIPSTLRKGKPRSQDHRAVPTAHGQVYVWMGSPSSPRTGYLRDLRGETRAVLPSTLWHFRIYFLLLESVWLS